MTVLVVAGTRPEAIKLAPVFLALRRMPGMDARFVAAAQHRQLLDQALAAFRIRPDYDLDVMRREQSLASLTARLLTSMGRLLQQTRPDMLLVQGDTTTVFASSLVAFYQNVPVGHVEAGLRSFRADDPFPEEMNRQLAARLATLHFAPTDGARDNLLREGICSDCIFVTGNPVVDAIRMIARGEKFARALKRVRVGAGRRLILVTLHRRESWGAPLSDMCRGLRRLAERYHEVEIAIPLHLNPKVRRHVLASLGSVDRIRLMEPVDYISFLALMKRSSFVLTDSGGVQEEAPVFGKPVLVLRQRTERPEAVSAGVARVIGTDAEDLVRACAELLGDPAVHERMSRPASPFGDGRAADRIARLVAQRIAAPSVRACELTRAEP
jgi:UDP-N-acetylglucosamine 2-epimerase (non-hydrolysing)